jgi:hypothetical protein
MCDLCHDSTDMSAIGPEVCTKTRVASFCTHLFVKYSIKVLVNYFCLQFRYSET